MKDTKEVLPMLVPLNQPTQLPVFTLAPRRKKTKKSLVTRLVLWLSRKFG